MQASGIEHIFLSYRHHDTAGLAARLAEDLDEAFGPGSVFRDVSSTEAGEAFPAEMRFALERSLVVIALIGPRWADELRKRAAGAASIDYVSYELVLARRLGIPIVPVLVDGAGMPAPGELPRELEFVATLQGLPLTGESWVPGFAALRDAIARRTGVAVRKGVPGRRLTVRSVGNLLAIPMEILIHPRRFLIRHSRGRPVDFALLAACAVLAFFLVALVIGVSIGTPPTFLLSAAIPATLVMALLVLVVTLVQAFMVYPILRLLGGKRAFLRFFLVLAFTELMIHVAVSLGIGIMMAVGPGLDEGVVLWRGELFRTEDATQWLEEFSNLPAYISPRSLQIAQAAFWGIGIALLAWTALAWQSIRVIHELSHARTGLVLGAFVLVNVLRLVL